MLGHTLCYGLLKLPAAAANSLRVGLISGISVKEGPDLVQASARHCQEVQKKEEQTTEGPDPRTN